MFSQTCKFAFPVGVLLVYQQIIRKITVISIAEDEKNEQ